MVFVLLLFVFASASATIDFQCWNIHSSNELREEYNNTIHTLRKKLARGKALNVIGTCPAGKSIYALQWDCLLELDAQKEVQNCQTRDEVDMMLTKKRPATCDAETLLKKTVNDWWDTVQGVGLPTGSTIFDDLSYKAFATLANGKATKVGCAQKNCNGTLHIACKFDVKTPALGTQIYEPGPACKKPKDCIFYDNPACYKPLCYLGYINPKTPTTTTQITTPPATTTTIITTTQANNRMCPGNDFVSTDKVRTTFVNTHNNLRSQLARGTLFNKQTNANARPATKMLKMKYDCDAEAGAYKWAKKCKNEQSPQDQRPGYTENRYLSSDMILNFEQTAKKAQEVWWSQFTEKGLPADNKFTFDLGVSQFSRMAWDSIPRFGCATSRCPGMINVVCRYKGGSKVGELIYEMGTVCSKCPKGTSCSNGLCA